MLALPEMDAVRTWPASAEIHSSQYSLADGQLRTVVVQEDGVATVWFWASLAGPLVLHWGLSQRASGGWQRPSEKLWPPGSTEAGADAVDSLFSIDSGVASLKLQIPAAELAGSGRSPSLSAVLYRPKTNQWLKNSGKDFLFPLQSRPMPPSTGGDSGLASRIVDAEVGSSSWTLMHRFELCTELLNQGDVGHEAMVLLFSWLRYSAIRQLDWQRHYNTQPGRLTHAQDRLTRCIATLWRSKTGDRAWVQMMLGTLGRGGNGQRVRDDILAIMHRHNLKEAGGTFIEQWHQKLHNNTTPDDIVICWAYLDFLRSGGQTDVFYRTLEWGGVGRERLRSYERAITTDPSMPSADIGALIWDFEQYRGLLTSVHGSTDLRAALDTVRGAIPGEIDGLVQQCLSAVSTDPAGTSAVAAQSAAVLARQRLEPLMDGERDDGRLRDLLYLDLALIDYVRCSVERSRGHGAKAEELSHSIDSVLKSALLDRRHDSELKACVGDWEQLLSRGASLDRDGALHGRSVVERLSRWVGDLAIRMVNELEAVAVPLGRAFEADDWAVRTFAEEVVRGGPLFAVGCLLGEVDRVLRTQAGLGPWQVISAGSGSGQVRHISSLREAQGQTFSSPVVLAVAHVGGEEEIAPGVVAVVTPSGVDLLSHLAVRARNAAVLLATVWDETLFSDLAAREGETLSLSSTVQGTVEIGTYRNTIGLRAANTPRPSVRLRKPESRGGVLRSTEFSGAVVGAKAHVLADLRRRLPDWIAVPSSIALGFGTFERVLESDVNESVCARLTALLREVDSAPEATLARIRETVLELQSPEPLAQQINEVAQSEGLPLLDPFEASWRAICTVWGSKWTDRAHFARVARSIASDQVFMSVLIQEVVPADYAFVLHTKNPQNGNPNELYGELVLGLGEALVGNYPGRALGFVADKKSGQLRIESYPSKSVVLRANGLIFRSDSNAEDLEGFAGAGLHDTVTAAPMRRETADYSRERLVWDPQFRSSLLERVVRVGIEIERVLGSAQDVEGVLVSDRAVVVQSRPQVGV